MVRSTESGRAKGTAPKSLPRSDPQVGPGRKHITLQRGPGIAKWPVDPRRIRRWIRAALEVELSLVLRFVDEPEARTLNRQWRSRDAACNILTFAYGPLGSQDETKLATADIVVCLPIVERESRERNIPYASHLAHLVIHGMLHAQGYTHDEEDAALRMEAREIAILKRFGVPDPYGS